jgi:hypothetical protein
MPASVSVDCAPRGRKPEGLAIPEVNPCPRNIAYLGQSHSVPAWHNVPFCPVRSRRIAGLSL